MADFSVLYLETWLLSSAIHYLLLPVIDYTLITACHRWNERTLSRTIYWKEKSSSRSRTLFGPDMCFTPTRFYFHG